MLYLTFIELQLQHYSGQFMWGLLLIMYLGFAD